MSLQIIKLLNSLSGVALGIFEKIRLPWVSLESLKESCVSGVFERILSLESLKGSGGASRCSRYKLWPKYILLTTEREKIEWGSVWYKWHPFVTAVVKNPSQMRGGVADKSSGERRRASRHRPLLPCVPPNHPAYPLSYFLHSFRQPLPLLSIFAVINLRAVMMWQQWQMPWNGQKGPPPAHVWIRGRWWWRETCRNGEMNHLRLAFGSEGGGGGGRHVEMAKWTTSGSRLDAREVVVGDMSKQRKGRWLWWETCQNGEKNHLRLAFGYEGGGCGGRRVKTSKWTTSSSRLDAREVVVMGDMSKRQNGPPPARV